MANLAWKWELDFVLCLHPPQYCHGLAPVSTIESELMCVGQTYKGEVKSTKAFCGFSKDLTSIFFDIVVVTKAAIACF